MWYSGIDQHKQSSVITTYGPEGPVVKQARLPSTPLALQQYFAQFPGPHQAVVESTGGWYWLADVLATLGVNLVVAHATRLKAISAAKVKTDQVDADTMALLLRAGLIPEAHMIRPEQRGPRVLMRTRLRLVRDLRTWMDPHCHGLCRRYVRRRSAPASLRRSSPYGQTFHEYL